VNLPYLTCIDQCVGKTSYLFVLLINRLLRGERTIFQSASGSVYEISDIVQELPRLKKPISEDDDVVALVDADSNQPYPTFEVRESGARIVATSSPKTKQSRMWMNHLPEGHVAMGLMMNPFSLQEYLLTGFVHLHLSFCLT
jgi:hypothetical protein